jgi:hypothetical protein
MRNNDHEGKVSGRKLVAIVAVFILAFAFFVWGRPWSGTHIASNPGPSGTSGSTKVNPPPPPATGPSETTTGTAR